jgi:hypothetical protein
MLRLRWHEQETDPSNPATRHDRCAIASSFLRGGLAYHGEMEMATVGEADAAVKTDGVGVTRADVQNRNFVAAENLADQLDHQRRRITVARVIRMRAHRANLGVAGHAHSLAGHRRKLPFPSDADEISQLMSARGERARLHHRRQANHLRDVRRRQLHKIERARRQFAERVNHLQQRILFHDSEAGGLDVSGIRGRFQNNSRARPGARKLSQREVSLASRLRKSRQGTNLRLKPSREAMAFRKMRLAGRQCGPNRIVQRMHAHDANLPPPAPPAPSDSRAQIIFISTNLDAVLRELSRSQHYPILAHSSRSSPKLAPQGSLSNVTSPASPASVTAALAIVSTKLWRTS